VCQPDKHASKILGEQKMNTAESTVSEQEPSEKAETVQPILRRRGKITGVVSSRPLIIMNAVGQVLTKVSVSPSHGLKARWSSHNCEPVRFYLKRKEMAEIVATLVGGTVVNESDEAK
jgi:hypothetical protein